MTQSRTCYCNVKVCTYQSVCVTDMLLYVSEYSYAMIPKVSSHAAVGPHVKLPSCLLAAY
jgi:hypothetical protein